MTLARIRTYEDKDKRHVQEAAERFCELNKIPFAGGDAESAIEHWMFTAPPEAAAYIRRLWKGAYCRALRVPFDDRTSIASGYIGVFIEDQRGQVTNL